MAVTPEAGWAEAALACSGTNTAADNESKAVDTVDKNRRGVRRTTVYILPESASRSRAAR